MPLKIVFMGTPEFSVPALHTLIKNKFSVFKVYTQPPKKSKRGQKVNPSPIEEFCKKNKISFNNPPNLNNEEELKIFKKLSPDIVIVVAYGQIIPKSFLDVVKLVKSTKSNILIPLFNFSLLTLLTGSAFFIFSKTFWNLVFHNLFN